jgi:hypothetical protein
MIAIIYLVKATVIVLTAAAVVALGRRRASSGTRHFVCTLGIGGLLTLPLVSSALPGWTTISLSPIVQKIQPILDTETGPPIQAGSPAGRAPGTNHTNLAAGTTDSSHPGARSSVLLQLPWAAVLRSIYLGGVCLLLVRLVGHHLTIRRLVHRSTEMTEPEWQALLADCAQQIGVRSSVRLLCNPDRMPPMTIGIRHMAIVLPALAAEWSDDVRRSCSCTSSRTSSVAIASRRQTPWPARCTGFTLAPGGWRGSCAATANSPATTSSSPPGSARQSMAATCSTWRTGLAVRLRRRWLPECHPPAV